MLPDAEVGWTSLRYLTNTGWKRKKECYYILVIQSYASESLLVYSGLESDVSRNSEHSNTATWYIYYDNAWGGHITLCAWPCNENWQTLYLTNYLTLLLTTENISMRKNYATNCEDVTYQLSSAVCILVWPVCSYARSCSLSLRRIFKAFQQIFPCLLPSYVWLELIVILCCHWIRDDPDNK